MARTRRLAIVAVTAAAAVLLAGGAQAGATTSKRAEARRFLAPIGAFERAVDTKRPQLEQLGHTWSAGVAPCLQAGYAELARQAKAGTLTENEATGYGAILLSVALSDAAVELAQPLDGALAKAQRAYRRMTLRDRVLRAGARGEARQIAALRKLQDIDTCRFIQTWTATGFSILDLPDMAPGLAVGDDIGGPAAARAVDRATRRLHRLGVRKTRIEDLQLFPLFSVAEPALDDSLLPPS